MREAIFEQWRSMYGPNFEFKMDWISRGRIGQDKFHAKVCHENAECVFCDHTSDIDKDVLQAAHIDDYHACKTKEYAMHPSNGVPLCPNHHTDYDKGHIKLWYNGQYHIEDEQRLVTATNEQVRQRLEHVNPEYVNNKHRRFV